MQYYFSGSELKSGFILPGLNDGLSLASPFPTSQVFAFAPMSARNLTGVESERIRKSALFPDPHALRGTCRTTELFNPFTVVEEVVDEPTGFTGGY